VFVNAVVDEVDLSHEKYYGITVNVGLLNAYVGMIERFPLTVVPVDPFCATGVKGALRVCVCVCVCFSSLIVQPAERSAAF
jgi:hypothetical protein